ncbi:hypothetical protein KJY74_25505 [Klebsiella pneumoniae subsp. pneumoniae]|uniref:hypothetical protein n=1 Tax=Klebsiella pneumoniae TaxID=573 RepID=UPI0021B2C7A4|nr:hypothetical protein [Klebsiella pneumoniae]MCT6795186.1 hypothetical protein [Klebsiella pneumoniae subsp. pneumoniae]
MDKDHLLLLEDPNQVARSEITVGTGSATFALTEAIKSFTNVSRREADTEDMNLQALQLTEDILKRAKCLTRIREI